MCDVFFMGNEIEFARYVDGNTPSVLDDKLDDVLDSVEKCIIKTF